MLYVLSFSGGLDSTSLLLHLLCKEKSIYAVSFDYGQKHKIELEFAKRNIDYLKSCGFSITHKVVDLSSLVTLLQSSLTDPNTDIPEGHYLDTNMKSTFVPNRNAIFSSIIYAYAISIHKKTNENVSVCLGVHSGDHLIYPDCRPEFYESIIKSFHLGNWDSSHIDTYLPYINFSKAKIIRDGIDSSDKLKLDFNKIYKNTLTTYSPDAEGRSNGKTGSDVERILSFNEIGVKDPGLYTQTWEKLLEYALQCNEEMDLKNQ
jgi:7-cyano-7-deazaguanine synthase